MIQIHHCVQNTPEWFAVRAGKPTASEFSTVMASGKGGAESKTRAAYLRKLAAEIITGEPGESFQSAAMERGKIMEADARERYAFERDVEPELVGFITNGPKGCSPDSLIGAGGLLEIKTQRADLLIETLFRSDAPPEHRAQCQGALWVCEREWIDLCVYWPKMPFLTFRIERDDAYIRDLERAVDAFNDELSALVDRIRSHGLSAGSGRGDEPRSAAA